ncbi:MAG TPA: hypothetical protein VGI28_13335 [Stellaceae bacterium]
MLKIKEFKGLPVATPTACALGPRTQVGVFGCKQVHLRRALECREDCAVSGIAFQPDEVALEPVAWHVGNFILLAVRRVDSPDLIEQERDMEIPC